MGRERWSGRGSRRGPAHTPAPCRSRRTGGRGPPRRPARPSSRGRLCLSLRCRRRGSVEGSSMGGLQMGSVHGCPCLRTCSRSTMWCCLSRLAAWATASATPRSARASAAPMAAVGVACDTPAMDEDAAACAAPPREAAACEASVAARETAAAAFVTAEQWGEGGVMSWAGNVNECPQRHATCLPLALQPQPPLPTPTRRPLGLQRRPPRPVHRQRGRAALQPLPGHPRWLRRQRTREC